MPQLNIKVKASVLGKPRFQYPWRKMDVNDYFLVPTNGYGERNSTRERIYKLAHQQSLVHSTKYEINNHNGYLAVRRVI
jgi:hypothetical protein